MKDFEQISSMVSLKFDIVTGYFVENNWLGRWGKFGRKDIGFRKPLQ